MRRKIIEQFEYEGFGFSVILRNVPVRTLRGVEVPDINYNALQKAVLEDLSHKPAPLTGHEVRFIRQSFEMTLAEFAKHFGVTHPAVVKWEKAKDKFAKITPSTELYIRLSILEFLKAKSRKFKEAFVAFDQNEGLKKQSLFSKTPVEPLMIESSRVVA